MLIDQIKQDRTVARTKRDTLKSDLLGTLLGEVCKNDKNPSDAVVVSGIKKFIANANECLKYKPYIDDAKEFKEIAILESYLPKQLTELELEEVIFLYWETGCTTLGDIMASLKKIYTGRYDGAMASRLAKELLAK